MKQSSFKSRDRLSSMCSDYAHKSETVSEVNIKVIVRCRPPITNTTCIYTNNNEISVKLPTKKDTKTFTFDGVCDFNADQSYLFESHIESLVDEVLQGFNCTIFAYGQTGTGKTYTMEGNWDSSLQSTPPTPPGVPEIRLPSKTGLIPRCLDRIVRAMNSKNLEMSVKVSYLEIYNEELNDLLQKGDKQSLRIYENTSGVASKGLAVKNLIEMPISDLPEVYDLLTSATRKRRTAETCLNRYSSRSHSIFTITVTSKESNFNNEDVVSIGKLNLVDLAGSENIQRSGTNNNHLRTKEAGLINQSLVALGRVINALTAPSNYIPYRDSKLTRLLQDSLGGKTKTCIIATISPDQSNVEETISTLDYGYRAKNVKNKPEINQRMTQKFMLKELTSELFKLKQSLIAAREKSGDVYLSLQDYEELQSNLKSSKFLAENLKKTEENLMSSTNMINLLQDEVNNYKLILNMIEEGYRSADRKLQIGEELSNNFAQIISKLAEYIDIYVNSINESNMNAQNFLDYTNKSFILYIKDKCEKYIENTDILISELITSVKSANVVNLENEPDCISERELDDINNMISEIEKVVNDRLNSFKLSVDKIYEKFKDKQLNIKNSNTGVGKITHVLEAILLSLKTSDEKLNNILLPYLNSDESNVKSIKVQDSQSIDEFNNQINSFKKTMQQEMIIMNKKFEDNMEVMQTKLIKLHTDELKKEKNKEKNRANEILSIHKNMVKIIVTNITNISNELAAFTRYFLSIHNFHSKKTDILKNQLFQHNDAIFIEINDNVEADESDGSKSLNHDDLSFFQQMKLFIKKFLARLLMKRIYSYIQKYFDNNYYLNAFSLDTKNFTQSVISDIDKLEKKGKETKLVISHVLNQISNYKFEDSMLKDIETAVNQYKSVNYCGFNNDVIESLKTFVIKKDLNVLPPNWRKIYDECQKESLVSLDTENEPIFN